MIQVYSDYNPYKIIALTRQNLPKAIKEMKSLAIQYHQFFKNGKYKGNSMDYTRLYNIWRGTRLTFKYKLDKDQYQDLKLVNAFFYYKYGDCKTFAIYSHALLTALGYDTYIKYVSYDNSPEPSHVYNIVILQDRKIIFDTTYPYFDQEPKYISEIIIK